MNEVMVEREGKTESKMPPQSQVQQFTQMTVALKRKIEEESLHTTPKKRLENNQIKKDSDPNFPPASYPIEFSPPRDETSEVSPLRGEEIPADFCKVPQPLDSPRLTIPEPPHQVPQLPMETPVKRRLEDDEDSPLTKRVCTYKEIAEDSRPPSALEEPLILPMENCKGEENKENLVCLKSIAENQNFDSILAKTLLAARADKKMELSPKVVVEHQDLPSIYELGQMKDMCSGLDDDEGDDSDDDSSMFDTPPPKSSPFVDRLFWTTSAAAGNTSSNPATPPAAVPVSGSTYQFLEQTNQRIECDENGKSYLQLGTVNHHHHTHHHIPVTPVIQPKPTTLAPRRPISLCRPVPPPRPPNPTPPCEHAHLSPAPRGCSSSTCYRQQRSDMLSLSLHKLHMARQRSDSSLRRSVLICNMLRYIEEESNTEQRHQEAAAYQQDTAALEQQQQQPYWNNLNAAQTLGNFAPPQTPNPYRDSSFQAAGDGFEAPLKDFNSAFRQSSGSSPSSSESDGDEDRGINWSSVLSLTSQTELDPLNNNTFSESSGIWSCSGSDLSDVDLSQASFDDVSWKLSPISADEVMKAFPEENMFECAA